MHSSATCQFWSRTINRAGSRLCLFSLSTILFFTLLFLKSILFFTPSVPNGVNENHSVRDTTQKHTYLQFDPNFYSVTEMIQVQTKLNMTSKRIDVPAISSTGSDDLDHPLNIDMPNLVERILSNRSVHVQPINDPQFNFVISNHHKCKDILESVDKPLDLLILIKSSPTNSLKRDAIRITWGNENCWGGRQIVRIFLLGSWEDMGSKYQNLIRLEAEQYGDIVQQDFIDTYYNNTYKMMLGFEWAIRYCPDAPIIMFVDDDFFIYPRNVVAYLEGLSDELKDRLISGYVWQHAAPIRTERNSYMKKWLITKSEYKPDFYPPYVAGGNFFISMPLARRLHIATRYTQFLRFDDVYLGIVLRKLLYTPIHQNQIYMQHFIDDKKINWSHVFSIHNYKTVASQLSLWTHLNCSDFCTDRGH